MRSCCLSLVVDALCDDVELVPLVLLHLPVPHAARERHAVAGHTARPDVLLTECHGDFHGHLHHDVAHATHAEAHERLRVGLQDEHLELLGFQWQRRFAQRILLWVLAGARAWLEEQTRLLARRQQTHCDSEKVMWW
jgi:hypothetical protein